MLLLLLERGATICSHILWEEVIKEEETGLQWAINLRRTFPPTSFHLRDIVINSTIMCSMSDPDYRTIWHRGQFDTTDNLTSDNWCQSVRGVKLSWCQIVRGVKLSAVSNCPRCQIPRGAKLSWCQIVLGPQIHTHHPIHSTTVDVIMSGDLSQCLFWPPLHSLQWGFHYSRANFSVEHKIDIFYKRKPPV